MPQTPSPTLETHLRSHKQAEQHALKRQARHRLLPSDPRGGGGVPVPFLHLSLLALKNTTHSLIPLPLTHTVFFFSLFASLSISLTGNILEHLCGDSLMSVSYSWLSSPTTGVPQTHSVCFSLHTQLHPPPRACVLSSHTHKHAHTHPSMHTHTHPSMCYCF